MLVGPDGASLEQIFQLTNQHDDIIIDFCDYCLSRGLIEKIQENEVRVVITKKGIDYYNASNSDFDIEFLDAILQVKNCGIGVSKISSITNLSHRKVLERCNSLEKSGLIIKIQKNDLESYYITTKGLEYYEDIYKLRTLLKCFHL